ncbi:MAG: tyrosine--tRNA ligase [Alphaproteobacteria bacterium]|nr:tyrosine--tRNA ligase [Alphaproteobacteria bacterium]
MAEFKSDFLAALDARGFIHDVTDAPSLDAVLCEGTPMPAYIGFDCTADSLHVGSLLPIMLLRWLQKTGHKPIVLMGGGTTKVGDPSGKDEARKMLTDDDIARNMDGIKKVFEKYLVFGDGPTDAVMLNNDAWLSELEYVPFLREYGRHFTINRMLSFDSVKLRLEREQPLTFLEFNYMILQAYDFLELNRRIGCRMQMGGSDQWGNIVNGVELTRRVDGKQVFGLTNPLLTTASGAKMGKTAQGAVWLNAERLSPFDFWQFWRNTEDADVPRFLKLFTELPLDEIDRLSALEGSEINQAKIVLATEATALCHGREEAEKAAETARQAFEQGAAAGGLPTITVPAADLAAGLGILQANTQAGLAKSNGEARRLIKQGGIRVNDVVVDSDERTLTPDDLVDGAIKLSAGKKRHVLLKVA